MNTIPTLQGTPTAGKISTLSGISSRQPLQQQAGQVLKAQVLEVRGESRFLLQVGENKLVARSEVPLRAGQTLQLQLTATSPELQLKIVGDTVNQFLGRSLTLIGNTIDTRSLFSALQQPSTLFQSLSFNSKQALDSFFSLQNNSPGSVENGAILKQLIDNIGLSFENLISRGGSEKASQSLKAALFEIIFTLKSGQQIQDNANRLLSTLEFFQLAQLHTDANQQFIFPLPLSFIEQGYLLVDRKDDESGEGGDYEKQDYRFSLHLKMTELGNLRIDFFHTAEGLFIRFHTESDEKSEFIESFSEELRKQITEAPIIGLSFAADADDPVAELARLILPEGKSVLDTTA